MRRCVAPRCLRLMPRPGAAAAARARASSAHAFAAARRRARRPRAAPRGRRPGRRWRGPGAPGRRRSTTRRARRPSASSRGTRPSSVVAAAGGSGLRARAGGRGERTHQRLRRGLRLRLLPPLLRVVRRACDGSTGRRVAASGGGRPRAAGGAPEPRSARRARSPCRRRGAAPRRQGTRRTPHTRRLSGATSAGRARAWTWRLRAAVRARCLFAVVPMPTKGQGMRWSRAPCGAARRLGEPAMLLHLARAGGCLPSNNDESRRVAAEDGRHGSPRRAPPLARRRAPHAASFRRR